MRDLARKRMQLVRSRTSHILAVENYGINPHAGSGIARRPTSPHIHVAKSSSRPYSPHKADAAAASGCRSAPDIAEKLPRAAVLRDGRGAIEQLATVLDVVFVAYLPCDCGHDDISPYTDAEAALSRCNRCAERGEPLAPDAGEAILLERVIAIHDACYLNNDKTDNPRYSSRSGVHAA